MKNAYKELPEGFVPVFRVDALQKKTGLALNVAALVLTILSAVGLFFLLLPGQSLAALLFPGTPAESAAWLIGFALCLISYLFLHELVHGIVYSAMTREKLRFGLSLSCAYCGVPNVYVSKKTALCALFAPFLTFSVLFLGLGVLASGTLRFWSLVLFSLHFGGCAGDLYDALVLLVRLRGEVLMKDTGPRQVFYQYQRKEK